MALNDTQDSFGESQAPGRSEDHRLLTGRGRFTADLARPDQAHAVFLRAAHAHAEIGGIDTAVAAAAPGVLGIFTGRDMAALGPLPCLRPPVDRDGRGPVQPPRRVLTIDRIRHVGEPIALIVAETLNQAQDAAELVGLDLSPLPAVTDIERALAEDAPQLWPDAPNNLAFDWESGDTAAVDAAFATARQVVRLRTINNRLAVCAMEPRTALAEFDASTDQFTLHTGSQGVTGMRDVLATHILKIEPTRLRVVSGDVGGGFGMKTQPYPEYAAILFAAERLGRVVKWTGTRSESFLSDNQARDGIIEGAMALDSNGRFLALKITALANMGAYLSASGPGIATRNMSWCLAGVYRTPAIQVNVKCVFTNTAPIGPYRGAGRPEASYIVERLVDQAAAELGVDRLDLRRLNFIAPDDLPYATPVSQTYDSGEFATILDQTLENADWAGFPERRDASMRRGRLRGLGIACFIEHAAARLAESIRLDFSADGTATLHSAAQSQGQGHATSFAQVVAQRLGIKQHQVYVLEGDSDLSPKGGATTGSRSMAVCGAAAVAACDTAIDTGRLMAAHLLETAPEDIAYELGKFGVVGTDRAIGLFDLVRSAGGPNWPSDLPSVLDTEIDHQAAAPTYPNGCHVCEVEIDRETGGVRLVRYSGVDDVGHVINPMIVDGQIHGGVVQGLGQVLSELCLYDPTGQLVSGSFMDYAVPRADEVPQFDFGFHVVPCTTNILGVKGAGESGTVGALPAVANAVMDALRTAGVSHFDMPATPERIWRLLHPE